MESWAWYGLQPINRLTMPGGTVLMTSLQSFESLLKDIHKKDTSLQAWPCFGPRRRFSGLWVHKEDHTEARILGALAKIAPSFLTHRRGRARRSRRPSGAPTSRSPPRARPTTGWRPATVKITEGNAEIPFSFEMPKWWEMREGVTIPAIPVGKPMEGGQGYVPERNPYFKKFTTRTMRPVIDFDTCVKCTLCWISSARTPAST